MPRPGDPRVQRQGVPDAGAHARTDAVGPARWPAAGWTVRLPRRGKGERPLAAELRAVPRARLPEEVWGLLNCVALVRDAAYIIIIEQYM